MFYGGGVAAVNTASAASYITPTVVNEVVLANDSFLNTSLPNKTLTITDTGVVKGTGHWIAAGFQGAALVEGYSIVNNGEVGTSDSRVAYVSGGYCSGLSGDVNSNSVTNSGTMNVVNGVAGGQAYGGNVDSNSVINSGNISFAPTEEISSIYGGWTQKGEATNNSVTISNGTVEVDAIVGGLAGKKLTQWSPPFGPVNKADGNRVEITGGTVTVKSVSGGQAKTNNNEVSSASSNKVILGAGSYKAVVGGMVASDSNLGTSTALDNTVTVYGTADLSNALLVGGLALKGSGAANTAGNLNTALAGGNQNGFVSEIDAIGTTQHPNVSFGTSTGNTLIFGSSDAQSAWTQDTIKFAGFFNEIRFDQAVWDKTITIQNFMGAADGKGATTVSAPNVAFSGIDALSQGNSYEMLKIDTIHSGSITVSSESNFTVGTSLQGTGTLSLSDDGKTVTYTVDTPVLTPQEQTHNAAMTASAGTTALTQGADTTSVATNNLAGSGVQGAQGFSSVGGGFGRSKTGSHVNLNSINFSVGLGTNIRSGAGLLSVGGAFEAGWGKFKNHFDAGAADPYIKKKGDVRYYGLALVSNYAWDSMWHANAALRFGRMKSKQSNALYNAANQQTYDANISSWYTGLELGAGKVIPLSEKNSIDLYGKYFFLYQDDDKFNAGGVYEVDSVKSHRLRLAGRFMHQASERTAFYAGLGVEHEFDGKAKLKVDGVQAKPTKMKGTRGYGEIGVSVKPAAATGWQFDFSLNGLAGSRYRGAGAKAEAKYMF